MKKRKLPILAIAAYAVVYVLDPSVFDSALEIFLGYLWEMIQILPAVIIVTGLIDVWVSRDTILRHFGSGSGLKGKLVSVMVGSLSAGPIYAAFPVTHSLLKKGASLSNIVIILSAWAVIKVPMLIVEAKFLGVDFMLARYVLTVPGILAIGLLTERLVSRNNVLEDAPSPDEDKLQRILDILPGYNCGACGCGSCAELAKAISEGETATRCVPGGEELESALEEFLAEDEAP